MLSIIVTCNDENDVSLSVLTLSYMLNVGKDTADILVHIIGPIDETDMVFDGEIL